MKKQALILCVLVASVCLLHAAPAAFESFCFKCHDATQTDGELDFGGFDGSEGRSGAVVCFEKRRQAS